ncbi:unnamed protein product [Linum trigynum]|uniref:Uncharacterized protein n=1 Tax=Linum trigynum TaxID=586398 RepID=A0AAV2D2V6_9ROSI
MPFSLDFEGCRSQILPEAILQRRLRPLAPIWADLIRVNFWQIPKGVPSQIFGDFPIMSFSFDSGGYKSRIQAEAILHR